MKRDTLRLSQHQLIETGKDWNGRYFIAFSGGASVFIRDTRELRKFLKLPKSIPMRESLESWLVSLEAMDRERTAKRTTTDTSERDTAVSVTEPLTSEAPIQQTSPSLSQELLATGFGPECHEDDDPTANTRMIV